MVRVSPLTFSRMKVRGQSSRTARKTCGNIIAGVGFSGMSPAEAEWLTGGTPCQEVYLLCIRCIIECCDIAFCDCPVDEAARAIETECVTGVMVTFDHGEVVKARTMCAERKAAGPGK